jgi:ABC-type oligopeptide transport system substrate-binding subunit
MKKLLLLALMLVFGITLTGCGGGTDEPDPEPLSCTAPQVLNDDGTACVDPVDPCVPSISPDGLFANKNLRLALSFALDRELITDTLGEGNVPAGGYVPPGFTDNNGLDFFAVAGNYGLETDDTNFAEAVQLFALAAEEMGLTVDELRGLLEQEEILINTSEAHGAVAQLLQEGWTATLGFTMPIQNEEWAVFQDSRSTGNFRITRGGWLTDFMDPSGMLTIFTSNNAYNDPNWYNAEFDTLMQEALATTDPAIHFAKLYEAQGIFMSEMPIIPVYHYSDTMLVSDRLQDWNRSVLGSVDFSQAYMQTGTTLNWNVGTAGPATIDPGLVGASDGGDIVNNTFEGLVREIDGEVLPGIAESWVTSTDGRTITFTLRDSLWSDGTALTAYDFEYAWLRGMDYRTASEYAWIWDYTNVVGAGAYAACSVTEDDPATTDVDESEGSNTVAECEALRAAVGVTAIDNNTLEVELVNPTPYFISLMAFYHFMPVQQAAVEAVGGEDGTWASDPALVVSNGPFMLTEYTTGDKLVLVKNPNYWNAAEVQLETINGFFNNNATSAYASFQAGQLDYIPSVPVSEVAALLADSSEFYQFPLLGTYYYSFQLDTNGNGINEEGTICPVD